MEDFFLKKLSGLEEDIRRCKRMVETAQGQEDFDRAAAILQRINNELEALVQIRRQVIRAGRTSRAVVVTGVDGSIEYVDAEFTSLTGYAPEEVVGKNPRILKSSRTPVEEYKRLWDTILSGGEWQGVFCNRKKNGEFYRESACILPITNSDGVITHFVKLAQNAPGRG